MHPVYKWAAVVVLFFLPHPRAFFFFAGFTATSIFFYLPGRAGGFRWSRVDTGARGSKVIDEEGEERRCPCVGTRLGVVGARAPCSRRVPGRLLRKGSAPQLSSPPPRRGGGHVSAHPADGGGGGSCMGGLLRGVRACRRAPTGQPQATALPPLSRRRRCHQRGK